MKLGIKHTVLFISLFAISVIADEPITHIVFNPQTGEPTTVQGAPPPQLVRQRQNIPVVERAIIQDFLIDPLSGRRVREVSDMVGNVVGKTYPTEEEARKSFETAVGKIAKEMPRGKELTEEQKKTAVDALIAVNKDPNSWEFKQAFEKISKSVQVASKTVEVQETKQALEDAAKKLGDADKDKKNNEEKTQKALKEVEDKIKKQQAQDAEREAIQDALAQQAAQNAAGGNGKGGGQGGGSGNGNSNRSQPPESPKFDNNQQQKHDFAEQLEKALNQKNNTPDLSSLFGNNNNNGSNSNSGNGKEKKDDFKFDLSPKTKQNEVKPVKAAASNAESNTPLDPTSGNSPNALDQFLSGPTSVPSLVQPNPANPALADNGEGGGGGSAAPNGFKGSPSSFDNSGAQEIFQGVGKVDYGDMPPPIRKGTTEFGGEGGEGGMGEGYTYSNNNGSNKKEPLVNELIFLSDNPRARGKGLMALVGYQMKEVCPMGSKAKAAVCNIGRAKAKREETISFNK
ncbi:MAG: hypothetical protein ACKOA8_09515 [Deltaproteobacteria bacterium]